MGSIDDEKLFRSIQVSFLARQGGVIEIFLKGLHGAQSGVKELNLKMNERRKPS